MTPSKHLVSLAFRAVLGNLSRTMAPDQESKHVTGESQRPAGGSSPRPARRSSRGRRGRGHRPRPSQAETQKSQAREAPKPEPLVEPTAPAGDIAPIGEAAPLPGEQPSLPVRQDEPRHPLSVQQAIEEVTHVITALKETLDDMEEVLETLELAERQKNADEQEIESLRRALRPLQRQREH